MTSAATPSRAPLAAPAAATVWSQPGPAAHLPVLDGVRGLAILLVLGHHQTIMGGTTTVDRWVFRLTDLGWCGVDLFFVLSGFLITGILWDAKDGPYFFRNFYVRRVLRIFPLYYAVVFFSLVILPRTPSLHPLVLHRPLPVDPNGLYYWTYLSNVLFAFRNDFEHSILGVSWSLAIEEQFYAVWPLLVWGFSRTALMRLCVGFVVTAAAIRAAMVLAGSHPIPVYVLPFTRIDALATGAIIALALRGPGRLRRLAAAAPIVAALAGAVVLLLWVRDVGNERWEGRLMQTAGYSSLALLFGSLLVAAVHGPPRSRLVRALSQPVLRTFGKYSYALYLVHFPAQIAVERLWFQPSPVPRVLGSELPAQLAFFGAATTASLVIAWLSWHLLEKHALALKRFFPTVR